MKLSYNYFVEMLQNIKSKSKGFFTGVDIGISDGSENYIFLDDSSTDGNCILFINEDVLVLKLTKTTFSQFRKMEIKSEYDYFAGENHDHVFVILEYNKHNIFIESFKNYEYDSDNYEYSKIFKSHLDFAFITIKNELFRD